MMPITALLSKAIHARVMRACFVLLSCVFVVPSHSQEAGCGLAPELERDVNKLLGASSVYDYSGTLLVEYGSDREFIAVNSRQGQGEGSLTRLNRQADAPLETVAVQPLDPTSACGLARFYAFSIESEQVVAGRAARRISIRPRDTLRLGYLMDIDAESGLPLRVVSATPEGQVLERFEFAQFQLGQAIEHVAVLAPKSAPDAFQFANLPPGFVVIGQGTSPVAHKVVSDGLASVSIFIEPQPRALAAGEGVALRGSTLAYTRGIPNNFLITVMGEIPITTARLLADAVRVPQVP